MRRIVREGLVVGTSQAIVVAGRFATVWWLTRLLDPAAFGQVALIQGIAALGFALLSGPLLQAGLRFHPEASRDGVVSGLHGVLRPLVARSAWWTFAVLLVGSLAWTQLAGAGTAPLAVLAGLVLIIPDAMRLYETNALNAARRQTEYAVWVAADAVARPAAAAAAIALTRPTPAAALTGMTVAALLVNGVGSRVFALEHASPSEPERTAETRRRVWRYAAPLVPLAILTWVVGLADRYVLAATAGTAAAGLYAAVYGIGSQGFLALGLFGLTVFRPSFFFAVDHGNVRQSRRVLWAWLFTVIAVSAAGVAGLTLWSGPITRLCLGPRFQSAAGLLPWIGAAYAFQAVQGVVEVLIYAKHKTRLLLPVQASGALTALVLYFVLIPRHGGLGAAWSTLAATAVACLVASVLGNLPGALRGKLV